MKPTTYIEIVRKVCTKCLTEKPLSEYPFDKRRDKHHTVCKECRYAQSRAWNKLNRQHRKEYDESIRNNAPFTRIFIKTCKVTGKLFVTPIATATVSQSARSEWTKYRYNKEKGINRIRIKDKLMHDQKGLCAICGATLSTAHKVSIDHKIPVSKGGTDDVSNLQLTCFKCNLIKGTLTDNNTVQMLIKQRKESQQHDTLYDYQNRI